MKEEPFLCAITQVLGGSSLTATSRKESAHCLTGGIYCFVALKVKSMLMENGSSNSRETLAFDQVPHVQLNPSFACKVCSG